MCDISFTVRFNNVQQLRYLITGEVDIHADSCWLMSDEGICSQEERYNWKFHWNVRLFFFSYNV